MLLSDIRVLLPGDCHFLVELSRQIRSEAKKSGTVEITEEIALELANRLDGMTKITTEGMASVAVEGEAATPPEEEPL